MKLRALKPQKIGDHIYQPGDVFDAPTDRNMLAVVNIGGAEIVHDEVKPQKSLTEEVKSDKVMPEVRQKNHLWYGVFVGEEQIGKSFRESDEETPKEIIDEWKKNNT